MDHLRGDWRGRAFVVTYNKTVALWIGTHEIKHDGEFFEFTIYHKKKYHISQLQKYLNDEKYNPHKVSYFGEDILYLFDLEQSAMNEFRTT